MSDHDPTGERPTRQTRPGKRARRTEPADQPPSDGGGVALATRPEEPRPRRSNARRITFWVGIGMILAGLSLLAYVAWQLWGTNWVSKRHQREIANQLQEDWAVGEGCDKFCPEGKASALIRIPKFGKNYAIPVLEGAADGTISGDTLAKGYGHFADTAQPGAVGNYALAAHRVTHGEPLRHMPDLRPGDKVIVETRTTTYTYVLDTNPGDLVIPFTETWVLDPLPHNPDPGEPEPKQVKNQRLITLTTCSEIFHTDNRMIAFGHLVSAQTKTVAKKAAG